MKKFISDNVHFFVIAAIVIAVYASVKVSKLAEPTDDKKKDEKAKS